VAVDVSIANGCTGVEGDPGLRYAPLLDSIRQSPSTTDTRPVAMLDVTPARTARPQLLPLEVDADPDVLAPAAALAQTCSAVMTSAQYGGHPEWHTTALRLTAVGH